MDWEALKKSLGEGFPGPRPLEWGQKQPLDPLKFIFPLPGENDWLLLYEELPHRGISCRSLFSCGDHGRAYFDRVRNPEHL